ncbi:flagellar basal body FlgE domain-containing protein, partial [Acinetobacter baumannii]
TTTWDVYATVDGKTLTTTSGGTTPLKLGSMVFDSTGTLTSGGAMTIDLRSTGTNPGIAKAGGNFASTIALSYTGSTQTGSAFVNLAQS